MIDIQFSCAMCGKVNHDAHMETDEVNKLNADTIQKEVEATGWIVQRNGESMDIYCSKECAA